MGQDAKQNNDVKSEEKQDKAPAKSRLGKEAKIGMLVILVLLAGLATTIVVRFRGSSAPDTVAAATDTGKAASTTPAPKSDPFQGYKSKSSSSSSPTIVPAKAASTKPPKTIGSDLDKWKMPANKPQSKSLARSSSSSDLPPLPPDPPKAAENRYDRYGLDATEGSAMTPAAKPLRSSTSDAHLLAPEMSVPPAAPSSTSAMASSRDSRRSHHDLVDNEAANDYAVPPETIPSSRDDANRGRAAALPPPPSRPSYAGAKPYSGSPGTSYAGAEGRTVSTGSSSLNDPNDYRGSSSDYRSNSSSPSYGSNFSRRSSATSSFANAPRRDDGKYEIQPNDSYWTISEKVYGSGSYFKALMQHNRANTGDERLQPGQLVATPPIAELEKAYPDLCPKASRRETMQSRAMTVSSRPQYRSGRTYTVAEGDTLFNIARYELGKASRWVEIYDLNREVLGKDFNYLTPGLQLTLPDGDKAEVIAQPPSSGFRR